MTSFMVMRRVFIILLGICAVTLAAAQTPSGNPQKFRALIEDVRDLHTKQQYAEALKRLEEAETLRQDNAMVNNIRGSIYTMMRDYAKARESFEASSKLKPDAYEPRFNLVELDFVEGKYQAAEAGFSGLLREFPKLQAGPRQLAQLKIVVCQLKQDKTEEAAASAKAFAFPDNSPAHYCSQAAFAFQQKDTAAALEWMNKAGKIFQRGEMVPYVDALVEAKWIQVAASNQPKK
ncbi:MAG TPA: hypothetical protein VLE43_04575 [Candidatus Saccharimonadia bacterium]|nr:hypothetical protein [Candidatus Saccharimonadia bacterium]